MTTEISGASVTAGSISIKIGLGDIVLYTGYKGETVVAIVTEMLNDKRLNLALVKNGIKQAALPDHVEDVPHYPTHPSGEQPQYSWRQR